MEEDRGKLYSSVNIIQHHDAREAVKRYYPTLDWTTRAGKERILDVGCGSGNITKNILLTEVLKIIKQTKVDAVGLDPSPNMIEYATQNHPQPGLKYVVADICQANETMLGGKFSKVFSIHCLHHVKDQRKAMQVIYDLLENGGEVVLHFAGRSGMSKSTETVANNPVWKQYIQDVKPLMRNNTPDQDKQYAALMQQAGFSNIKCERTLRILRICNEHCILTPSTSPLTSWTSSSWRCVRSPSDLLIPTGPPSAL